jgi:hypothetical protein
VVYAGTAATPTSTRTEPLLCVGHRVASVSPSGFLCFSHVRGLLQWGTRLPLVHGQLLPAPVLVYLRVKLQLLHAYTTEKPRDRDAKQDLPHDLERVSKGIAHLVLQRLLQRRNDRYRRERDLDALRELREERGGQVSLQLVL